MVLGPTPASPALGCSGPAGLQGLPSAVGHAGMSSCPCSHWAEAGSPLPSSLGLPGRRGYSLGLLEGSGSAPHPVCTLIQPHPGLG